MAEPDSPAVVGKQIGARIYVHRLALAGLPEPLVEMAGVLLAACPDAEARANVLKFDEVARTVSALNYPDFFSAAPYGFC